MPLITRPGFYEGVDAELYHGSEICPAPSISATGLKTLSRSPLHYWWGSNLNPERPVVAERPHFAIGKAAHDILLLGERWPDRYFVLPESFNARASKAQADIHAERDAAVERGLVVLTSDQAAMVEAMAAAIHADKLATALLTAGVPEATLASIDEPTGVWKRARPDFLPDAHSIIPDLKFMADGSPDAFERSAHQFGYFRGAAHYLDVIAEVFGPNETRRFVFIVVEKEPPFVVTLYQPDEEDLQRARMLNRRAIDTFARCLETGLWPAYAPLDGEGYPTVLPVSTPRWAAKRIDDAAERGELNYAA